MSREPIDVKRALLIGPSDIRRAAPRLAQLQLISFAIAVAGLGIRALGVDRAGAIIFVIGLFGAAAFSLCAYLVALQRNAAARKRQRTS